MADVADPAETAGDHIAAGGATPTTSAPSAAVEDDVVEAEESPTNPQEKPTEARRRFWGLCGSRKGYPGASAPTRDLSRQKLLWEFSVSINRFQFVGSETTMPCFFAVSLQPTKKESKSVRLLTQYSPKYDLDKTGPLVLNRPSVFYERKAFRASQSELGKLELKVAMWKVSRWTFNSYHGVTTRSLEQILSREPNTSMLLQETLTEADREEKKKHKRPISDVAVVFGEVILEEVFDVKLFFENWKFFPDNEKKEKKEDKQLTFVVPKNFQANPSKNQKCQVVSTNWRRDGSSLNPYFWKATTQIAKVRGTRRAVQQMYFIAKLFSAKPVNDRHPVTTFIASTVFNLQSVLDIPNFKGTMKSLTHDESFFRVGRVEGSVTCIFFSVGQSVPSKTEVFQPRTSSSVGHLNSSEMHLVVQVRKCESLAIADEEKGVSSPFLRVSWDNMMQTSFVLKNTIRPTFNHTFYFPVRFFNEKITSRKYLETAFLYEMRSKGDIQIQVWHHDDASSTSLGFTTVSLVSVLQSNHEIKCTLRGRVKTGRDAAEGEELDVPQSAAGAWYDQERAVRWFDGSRTPLVGCQIANPNQPLLHFEAFFYPAWPTDFHGLTEFAQEEADALDWPNKEAAFIQRNETFAENFAGPFPDSIGAKRCVALGQMGDIRSFPCIGLHPMNLEPLPLMAFLAETTVSQDYIPPAKLLHWMHCITYTMSTKQERTGMIYKEMWKDPQYLLFSRKGSPQDHAILLCSVLLGMSRDAYVVKGTIQVPTAMSKPKLVEHVWVMTREDGGWVTFWEPSTREFYHLPNRWVETKKKVLAEPKVQKTNEEDDEEEDETALAIQDFTSHEVGDVMVELDGVPTVGRGPRPKAKAKLGRDLVKQQMLETQRFLPTAPKSQLLGEQSLVDWLPYDSIDVVFNKTQLWANRQNQHPACITYNFEDSYPINEAQEATGTWMTLLSDEERSNYSIRYVTDNVLMEPSLKHSQLRQLESQLVTESQENLRLLRGRIGKDTIFDHRPQLLEQLDQFLHIHEEIATLDVDFCPLWDTDSAKWNDAESYLARLLAPHFQERFNKFGTAFNQPDRKGKYRYYTTVQAAEQKGWHQVLAKIRSFKEGKSVFPTMKGKVFGGFPLHFSSADKDLIRDYVMKSSEYQELIHQHDDSIFTIHCHIFPLPGGITSTWLFFGTQSPLKDS